MRLPMNFHSRCLSIFFLILAGTAPARADDAVADPAAPKPAMDVLVYPDGDRVQGQFVERIEDDFVFQSERFGLLRVPAEGARIIFAKKPAKGVAALPAEELAGSTTEGEAELPGPAVLTRLAATLRTAFAPWTGRFAFSTEVVTDTADRTNISVELQLKRKWQADELQLKARYDFNETSGRTTTDMLKADGQWRHDFRGKGFMHYRPVLEWSRASFRAGAPSDYLLLQQEIGAGLNLVATPRTKVRAGVSENLFDVWGLTPGGDHDTRTMEAVFLENEFKMPWSLLLVQRGVYYYSIATEENGWENRVELTKKFTKTISTAVRHEVRRGSPDGKSQDYTRLKLLLGLDF